MRRTEVFVQAPDIQKQRAAARKTAWILAIVVVVIFTAFILSGVIGKG